MTWCRGFLEGPNGHLSVVEHLPRSAPRGSIVVVPPFAEEMNVTRSVASKMARCFAHNGFSCLLLDLSGTGESGARFAEATVGGWLGDVLAVQRALQQEPQPFAGFVGIRFGALLAAMAASNLAEPCSIALWQPPVRGSSQLDELVSQRLLSDRLSGRAPGCTRTELLTELYEGQGLEQGGYRISSALARGMRELELARLIKPDLHCYWAAELASTRQAASGSQLPSSIEQRRFRGTPFWRQADGPTPWELINATQAFFSG